MRIDENHWLRGIRKVPSPNADSRPDAADIVLVVLHGISLPPGRFGGACIEELFTNKLDPAAHPSFASLDGVRVSAHLFIDRRGRVTQFVPFDARAWHAGVSNWRGRQRCNDFSIGIELEGTDDRPYTRAQYRRLVPVLRALLGRYPRLGLDCIAGHAEIAPGRKTDPGPAFDWAGLYQRLRA
ncbi:MAG: 1,6-anhydro-N-acetylmuramyl-L-alanine amidase AmpD [Pseudomonadales bacterium]